MPRTARSPLVQDLDPLRHDITGRLSKSEEQITKLRKQVKEIAEALAQAEADHKVLAQLAKVAGTAPRRAGTRGTAARKAGTRGAGTRSRRGSGERAKQLLQVVGGGENVTKKDLVAKLGVSEVRVQQLLTQAKKQGFIKSSPLAGSRRTLVWALTASGKRELG